MSQPGQPKPEISSVSGSVLFSNGEALLNSTIVANDIDLRSRRVLGQSKIQPDGTYKISYTSQGYCRADKSRADLSFDVKDQQGALIYSTPLADIVFYAPVEATVDITVPAKEPPVKIELQTVLAAIKPLLECAGLKSPAQLCEDDKNRDITFLAGETGHDPSLITNIVVAFRLGEIHKQVHPEFFYAILAQGTLLNTDLSSSTGLPVLTIDLSTPVRPLIYDLALLSPDSLSSAVKTAVTNHRVSPELLKTAPGFIKSFSSLKDEAQKYKDTQGSAAVEKKIEFMIASGQADKLLHTLTTDAQGDLLSTFEQLQDALLPKDAQAENKETAQSSGSGHNISGLASSIFPHVTDSLMRSIVKQHSLKDERELLDIRPDDLKQTLKKLSSRTSMEVPQLDNAENAIRSQLEKKYPTAAFAAALSRDKSAFREARGILLDKIRSDSELDLATVNIESLFPKSGADDGETFRQAKLTMSSFQRLFKVTPQFNHVKAMMDAGIKSSSKIHAMGRKRFEKVLLEAQPSMDAESTRSIFERATNIAIGASIRAADLAAATGATRIAALSPTNLQLQAVAAEFPNLKTLFQMGDFCACSECRTVHSTSAYVADTLHYLGERTVIDKDPPPGQPASQVAKDVLFKRRPDLGDMDLSCDNTNITLPYIDVVCELLEDNISPNPGVRYVGSITTGPVSTSLLTALNRSGMHFTSMAFVTDPNTLAPKARIVRDKRGVAKLVQAGPNIWRIFELKQTYGPQDQVSAVPQYTNQAAYTILENAEYAFNLPFSLADQEMGSYFAQFDVSRTDLMKNLQVSAVPSSADIAAKVLGLTVKEYNLINTAQPSRQDIYWNTGATGVPAVTSMAVVSTFVDKTGLKYSELQGLLKLSWINPSDTMFIQHLDNSCDLAEKRIANLDNPALDRFHRFIRLKRKILVPSVILNRMITAKNIGNGILGKQATSPDSLLILADLQQLHERLSLPWETLSYMFDSISTTGNLQSPYGLLFLNSSKSGQINQDFTPENLASNGALGAAAKTITDGNAVDYLALCLGTSALNIKSLIAIIGKDPVLNLENVSAVYSLLKLSRSLRLQPEDLRICQKLVGSDLLKSPAAVLDFTQKFAIIKTSNVKPVDLKYYLTHEAIDLKTRDASDTQIATLLDKLKSGYSIITTDNKSPYDPNSTADANLSAVSDLISKLPDLKPTDISIFKAMLAGTPWSDPNISATDFINQKLEKFVPDRSEIIAAQANLASAPLTDNEDQRKALLKVIAEKLSAYFLSFAQDELLISTVVAELKISEDLTPVLLRNAKITTPAIATATPLIQVLKGKFELSPSPDGDNKSRTLRLLQVMDRFIATLDLPPDLIQWMFQNDSSLGIMQLDKLKYQDDDALPVIDISLWFGLQDMLHLVQSYPPVTDPANITKPLSVFGMFDLILSTSASVPSILQYFSQLSGLDETVLVDLSSHFSYTEASFKFVSTFRKLEHAAVLLRTLGLSVELGRAVTKATSGSSETGIMRSALKARYEDSDWVGVFKKIQDPLRRLKRDALVNYLLSTNPVFKSADELYDHFLIDVQMGSCMETSRVVQAHATIQLFVQRCLLGLEVHGVANTTEDPRWSEWTQWMANYRLWELNKKLYLFPHAFLNQGIRRDKSEIYLNFETSLQQDQLTDSTLESSFAKYLEELHGVAHMDVMTCYYETSKGTMHVVARTKGGDPPTFYHREFRQERSWTPWSTINVDITGDTLMMFDRNSRLTLAWPIFTEESDPAQISQGPNIPEGDKIKDPGKKSEKVRKRWKIQLAVSERVDGAWTAKKVSRQALFYPRPSASKQYISVDRLETVHPQTSFSFLPYSGTGLGQAIGCWSLAVEPGARPTWRGAFALVGCSGYPEATQAKYDGPLVPLPLFEDTKLETGRFLKNDNGLQTEFAMLWILSLSEFMPLLQQPDFRYTVTYPLQLTLVDQIAAVLIAVLTSTSKFNEYSKQRRGVLYQFGTFMPFFYGDKDRSYTIIPGLYDSPKQRGFGSPTVAKTYADLFRFVQAAYNLALEYMKAYQTDPDPAKTPQKLLAQIKEDKVYKQLMNEYTAIVAAKLTFHHRFRNFYHPLICSLRIALNATGIPGLMDRKLQIKQTDFSFFDTYDPAPTVYRIYPVENLDFDSDGSYASYNWELFFHGVYQVAGKLNEDQQFAKAQSWYHHIFNPLGAGDDPAPQKYWVTKPFQQRSKAGYLQQQIDTILGRIATDPDEVDPQVDELRKSILDWRANPFDPWAIAKTRTVEYQIAVVLAYIKNLCDWGDSLFRQFTREAVTQATQMYILAHKLLGPKPRIVPPAIEMPIQSYNELESKIDAAGNALIDLEHFIPELGNMPHGGAELPPLPFTALFFCIPPDENLLSYWDLVDDRLTKIRTCRNIDGVEASLSLFSPPIDFGALSRALAGGMDASNFLAGLNSPLPNYRFQVMVQKAAEIASFASTLGNGLLEALEKRDAEMMARLRSQDQLIVLNSIRDVKLGVIKEAKSAVEGLELTKAISSTKHDYYTSQSFMNAWEITATALAGGSLLCQAAIAVGYALSGGLKLLPSFLIGGAGFGGSPTATVETGGDQIGGGAEMVVNTLSAIALGLEKAAGMASTQGSYRRREDEWKLQGDIASAEMADIDGKIVTAKFHYDNAVFDLASHDKQFDCAKVEDTFLHSKYTNQELYDWMARQTSQTYLAAYKLAFDMGRKAERCYQIELGREDAFLSFGFDSLKKGLKAADSLQASLHLMSSSYLDNDKREYELTKNVSLRQLDPRALIALKTTGKTTIAVPEAVFDLDYPGHYMRRHKSVSVSIPCVTGPCTSVSCKLSLVNNRYRRTIEMLTSQTTGEPVYDEQGPGNDTRFSYNIGSIQSIATSTGVADSGLFNLNFQDSRYLPFEGTGAIATWNLEFPSALPSFDFSTIADVILNIKYTAREGGSTLADAVRKIQLDEVNAMLNAAKQAGLFQFYSFRQAFPAAWNQMRISPDNTASPTFEISSLPFFVRGQEPQIDEVRLFASMNPAALPAGQKTPKKIKIKVAGEATPTELDENKKVVGQYEGKSSTVVEFGTAFQFQFVLLTSEQVAAMQDVVVVVHYVLNGPS